jgi:nucleoside-diphosphate-sugar epimerase
MPRVLITGITGFVGSNLTRYLTKLENYSVVGVSRDPTKAKEHFSGEKIEVIADYSASTFNDQKVDVVIHLAGIAHDLGGQYGPQDYYRINDEGTRRAFDEFLKSKASKFIFVSSIKAAADVSSTPVKEDIVPRPATDYGKSKLNAERYIQSRPAVAGKNYYILRPCMIHGQGNKGNLNLLYRFVRTGLPLPLGAFNNRRSFLSIDNFIFVVKHLFENETKSGVFHLSDVGYLSTSELYGLIASALGRRPRIWNIPRKWIRVAATIVRQTHKVNKLTEDMIVSNEKILEELKTPMPTELREGIIKTIMSFDE